MFKLEKEAIEDSGLEIKSPEDALKVFKTYWPYLKKVLLTVKIFTGAKADAFIDRIIEAGEMLK